MTNLESALAAQRGAAADFASAALAVDETLWSQPRSPGKWSRAQVAYHVIVSTGVARNAILGTSGMGSIPGFLRWMARRFYFEKVLASGFPEKGAGPPVFAPSASPAPRPELMRRLGDTIAAFEEEARASERAGRTSFEHGFFGRIAIADYVRFNALHIEHHRRQLG